MTNQEPADGVSNVSKVPNKKASGPKPAEAHSILSRDGNITYDLIWHQGRMAWVKYAKSAKFPLTGATQFPPNGAT